MSTTEHDAREVEATTTSRSDLTRPRRAAAAKAAAKDAKDRPAFVANWRKRCG